MDISIFFIDDVATQQLCLLDVTQLNDTLKDLKCSDCNQQSLCFSWDDVNLGFCYTLSLHCSTCETVVSKTFTSPRCKSQYVGTFTVNDLMVRSIGWAKGILLKNNSQHYMG